MHVYIDSKNYHLTLTLYKVWIDRYYIKVKYYIYIVADTEHTFKKYTST